MKGIFILEYENEDDKDRIATSLISHNLIDSVSYIPEHTFRKAADEAISEAVRNYGHPQSVDSVGGAVDDIVSFVYRGAWDDDAAPAT